MRKQLRAAIVSLAMFTLITGVMYPLVVTGIARLAFPRKAGGSLIVRDGRASGSELIGQPFDDPRYFWGRPSATGPHPYNAAASSGSNLGPVKPLSCGRREGYASKRCGPPTPKTPNPSRLTW